MLSIVHYHSWASNHPSADTSLHNKVGVSLVSEEEAGHFGFLDPCLSEDSGPYNRGPVEVA